VGQNKITLAKTEKYLITPESIDEAAKSISELIDGLNENPENVSKPAIYVSDEPENLSLIFKTLAKYDLDKKAIICGENKIDINDKDSIDITFTGSLNVLNSKLTKDLLHNKFGSQYLSYWDKMAYDLGLVTSYAVGTEDFNKDAFIQKLDNPSGYIGISGALRLKDNITERKYDIIRRQGSEYETLNRDKSRF
jgi:hypothetical protein